MELWTTLLERPRDAFELAVRREAEGWDGVTVADTQYYFSDPYALLGAIAARTTTLQLSIGTSNPVSRHPSVTASAISTVQAVSGGRATLGIGRGDSALFYIGKSPATTKQFERALELIRALTRGQTVQLPPVEDVTAITGHHETEGALRWLDPTIPPVRIDVYGSGPRTTEIAARLADRLTAAVGADPVRLAGFQQMLRDAVPAGETGPGFGAALLVAPHEDKTVARSLIRGFVTAHARFATMSGARVGDVSESDRKTMEAAATGYDMAEHGASRSSAAQVVPDEFIDRFAIVGDVDECAERLVEIAGLGLNHVLVMPPGADNDRDHRQQSLSLLNEKVLPAVRSAIGRS